MEPPPVRLTFGQNLKPGPVKPLWSTRKQPLPITKLRPPQVVGSLCRRKTLGGICRKLKKPRGARSSRCQLAVQCRLHPLEQERSRDLSLEATTQHGWVTCQYWHRALPQPLALDPGTQRPVRSAGLGQQAEEGEERAWTFPPRLEWIPPGQEGSWPQGK